MLPAGRLIDPCSSPHMKKARKYGPNLKFDRDGRIRTGDPLTPSQVR